MFIITERVNQELEVLEWGNKPLVSVYCVVRMGFLYKLMETVLI